MHISDQHNYRQVHLDIDIKGTYTYTGKCATCVNMRVFLTHDKQTFNAW